MCISFVLVKVSCLSTAGSLAPVNPGCIPAAVVVGSSQSGSSSNSAVRQVSYLF